MHPSAASKTWSTRSGRCHSIARQASAPSSRGGWTRVLRNLSRKTTARLYLVWALQQTLANVFAGVILHLTHPFTIGEHVRIRGSFGGELSGTILGISLTNTVST